VLELGEWQRASIISPNQLAIKIKILLPLSQNIRRLSFS
jgi:hypothetical protein